MTQTMSPQANPTTAQAQKVDVYRRMFEFQQGIFQNALEDLSETAALQRPSSNSNHINWLLGHLLHCRYMLANVVGVPTTNPFGEIYWNALQDMNYPALIEVTAHWPEITSQLLEKLSTFCDDDLQSRESADKPSLEEMIAFFVYHEAYHLGQIGIVRKIIGVGAMKSF